MKALCAFLFLIASPAHAVINGKVVKDGDPVAMSTVAVDASTGNTCTGSLIAPDIVITAAHCLMTKPAPLQVTVKFWEQAKKRHRVRTLGYELHPGFKPKGKFNSPHDLALIRLLDPIPAGFAPAELLRDGSLLRPGDEVVVAGFGQRKADDPTSTEFLLRATTTVKARYSSREILIDSSKAGTCTGDSGGPSFVVREGSYLLLGVVGSGDAACAVDELHFRIDAYRDWIEKTMRVLRERRPEPQR